jgi:hypothetical protein
MVVDRGRGQAVGTNPKRVRGQRDPDVDLALPQSQLHLLDRPRILQPENRGIQALVVHGDSSPWACGPPGKVPPAVERRGA